MIIEPPAKDGLDQAIRNYYESPWHRKSARCAFCGKPAARFLNFPGNVIAPACRDQSCAADSAPGAIECGGEEF